MLGSEGGLDEKEELLLRVQAILERALGPEHPRLATVINNLAEVYRQQGRLDEAETLLLRSLAIYAQALSPVPARR